MCVQLQCVPFLKDVKIKVNVNIKRNTLYNKLGRDCKDLSTFAWPKKSAATDIQSLTHII